MKKKENEPKRHHTVPKFYLNGFGAQKRDRFQLCAISRTAEKVIHTNTSDATVVSDFYRIGEPDPSALEEFFGSIEEAASVVIRKIVNHDDWPLSEDDRVSLAQLIAFQYLRGRHVRDFVSERVHQVLNEFLAENVDNRNNWIAEGSSVGEASDAKFDKLSKTSTDSSTIEFAVPASPHVALIYQMFPLVLDAVLRSSWRLVRFGDESLLTSDSPVGVIPPNDVPVGGRTGMADALCFLFPLSRKSGLVLKPLPSSIPVRLDSGRDRRTLATPHLARLFNGVTASHAYQWLYSHPDDRSLLQEPFPTPLRPFPISNAMENALQLWSD